MADETSASIVLFADFDSANMARYERVYKLSNSSSNGSLLNASNQSTLTNAASSTANLNGQSNKQGSGINIDHFFLCYIFMFLIKKWIKIKKTRVKRRRRRRFKWVVKSTTLSLTCGRSRTVTTVRWGRIQIEHGSTLAYAAATENSSNLTWWIWTSRVGCSKWECCPFLKQFRAMKSGLEFIPNPPGR